MKLIVNFVLNVIFFIVSVSSEKNLKVNHNYDALEILNLGPPFYQFWAYKTPDEAQIKSSYRELSLKYHPDKNSAPDASEKFNEVREAYDYLKGNSREAQERRLQVAKRYEDRGAYIKFVQDVLLQTQQLIVHYFVVYVIHGPEHLMAAVHFVYLHPKYCADMAWVTVTSMSLKELLYWLVTGYFAFKVAMFFMYLLKKFVRSLTSHSEQEVNRRRRAAYERKQRELEKR